MTNQPEIFIVEASQPSVEINAGVNVELQVVEPAPASVLEVSVPGPQGPTGPEGPTGPPGPSSLSGLDDVDLSGKTNGSVLYYSAAIGKVVADDINTLVTLTDGGNF